ncbi:nuclear pore complex component [Phlyctema vagabunda]|uniref:Nuclear pore complex component n=1 Tax=Phlyctema vagabunda TaxID=108571 RepID=A0ABR4PI80_9HELO
MSTPVRPSTPLGDNGSPSTPGTWRHPRFDEIAKRQNAATFTDRNFRKIIYNVAGLVVLYAVERLLGAYFPRPYQAAGELLSPYSTYVRWLIQIVFVFNTIVASRPLFKSPDDLSDIALTAAQRKLLGLPPSSAPPTPGSQYLTPPKYRRTSTPLSGSPSSNRGSPSDSPLSGSVQGSPFSLNASPLLQKAMGGGYNGARRSSYGSPSPLGPGNARSSFGEMPGTPSPSTGKGTSLGLNNKWLFDKGRRSSGSARLYT